MFAVIRTGGKQYRVAKDDRLEVERLVGEPGELVEINDVLMIGEAGKAPTLGSDELGNAAVFAEVVEQKRSDKIIVFKKNRRQGYRRRGGHRQHLTVLRVADISLTGKMTATVAPAKAKDEAPKAKAEADAAPKEAAVAAKPKAEPKTDPKPKAEADDKGKKE
jgi:large subunit ribosomal protein L21